MFSGSPIHGADVVLGGEWLQTLGWFMSRLYVPWIQFSHNTEIVTLTESPPISISLVSLAQFSGFLFTDSIESMHSVSFSHDTTIPNAIDSTPIIDTSKLHPAIPQGLLPPCS